MLNDAVIGVGSNIDATYNIAQARSLITYHETLVAESTPRITKPIGLTTQPDFTNLAWRIKTNKSHEALNEFLKTIENTLGRDHQASKYGPRTIDLDIVIFNGQLIDHDIITRDFLFNSVLEVYPELTGITR